MRTAIVTGAGGRVGGAVARALAEDGWRVVLVARAETAAVGALSVALGAPVELADLADEGATRALAARLGEASALVHCASRFRAEPLLSADATAWRADVAIEAEALHTLAARLIPAMRAARFGRVVAFGLAGLERWPGYTESTGHAVGKAAALVVARGLARAVAGDGITVNVIAPGAVGDGAPPAIARRARAATPEELAAIVRFLLSDAAAAITGAVVPAAGALGLEP